LRGRVVAGARRGAGHASAPARYSAIGCEFYARAFKHALALACALALATPAMARPVKLLVLGDSLAAGFGLALQDAFPARLEADLKARGLDVKVVNGGVSGDTSAGGLARLDWVLADAPEAAIVELGGNDGLRAIEPAVTFANLDAILTRLKARGVRVLLAGMHAPPNLGRIYTDAFHDVFHRLAAKHDVALYPFFLEGVAAEPRLNQPDGIHPNAAGVQVIVDRIGPHVVRLLAERR